MSTNAISSSSSFRGPTSFEFVNFSDVDRMRDSKAISSIQRHAMKDIGRERRKPKQKRSAEPSLEVPLDFIAEAELTQAMRPGAKTGETSQYWTELRRAFQEDDVPKLSLPRSWLTKARYYDDPSTYGCDLAQQLIENDMRCPLVRVFLDLVELAEMIDTNLRGVRQDDGKSADILIRTNVLAHQLLELRPFQSSCDKFDDNTRLVLESWRHSMLMVIGIMYEAYSAATLSSAPYVEKQHLLMSKNSIEWDGFMRTKLWMAYLAALVADQNPARRR